MKNLSEISYEMVHKGKPNDNTIVQTRINDLLIALHDAINSPKGVVPKSANEFYCQEYYIGKLGEME